MEHWLDMVALLEDASLDEVVGDGIINCQFTERSGINYPQRPGINYPQLRLCDLVFTRTNATRIQLSFVLDFSRERMPRLHPAFSVRGFEVPWTIEQL